jgi:hypothetical protein
MEDRLPKLRKDLTHDSLMQVSQAVTPAVRLLC